MKETLEMDSLSRLIMSVCLTPSCELYFESLPLEIHKVSYT